MSKTQEQKIKERLKALSSQLSAEEERMLYGVSDGIIRGRCIENGCLCTQFISLSGGGPCEKKYSDCGHFPESHTYWGQVKKKCGVDTCSCTKFLKWNESDVRAGEYEGKCFCCGHEDGDHNESPYFWSIDPDEVEIISELGAGAFGNVYKGKIWGVEVAVKKVRARNIGEAGMELLINEINILSKIRHPNVISLIAGCLDPKNFCIVVDLAAKGSLLHILNSDIEISWEIILKFARDISLGMSYLHSKKILHRDLKADNILVTSDNLCKISDFGLASIITKKSRNLMYGTPFWMSPEVISKEIFTKKSDVYSFAVILVELVTREIPYLNTDIEEEMIMKVVIMQDLRPDIPLWCPEDYRTLCERSWDKDPAERPTFPEIIAIIEDIISKNHNISPIIREERLIQIDLEQNDDFSVGIIEKKSNIVFESRNNSKMDFTKRYHLQYLTLSLLGIQNQDGTWDNLDKFEKCARSKETKLSNLCREKHGDDPFFLTFSAQTIIQYTLDFFNSLDDQNIDVPVTNLVQAGEYETKNDTFTSTPPTQILYNQIEEKKIKNPDHPWENWNVQAIENTPQTNQWHSEITRNLVNFNPKYY